jgi:hypothetical protein
MQKVYVAYPRTLRQQEIAYNKIDNFFTSMLGMISDGHVY